MEASTPAWNFLLNPPGVERAYLEALQRHFAGWGGHAEFVWWFRRPVGAPAADLLVLTTGGDTLVAGAAVTYRRLGVGSERQELAGIVTGAWTAPQYRRRGCFSELIERARRVAGGRGATLLLAFCSAEQPARAPLAKASFAEAEGWHIPGGGGETPPDRRARRPSNADLHRWFHENRVGAGVDYPTVEIFAEQALLNHPLTRVAEAPGGLWGVLAAARSGGGTQAVIAEELMPDPMAVAAALGVWRLPAYTTDPVVAAKVPCTRSYVFGITVGEETPPPPWPARWALHMMDRA